MLLSKKVSNFSSNSTEISNIILFSTAGCISLFGTYIYNFALSLHVLKITGSGLSFATTMVLSILAPLIINPFAGVIADKVDKKLIAIAADVLNSFLLLVLYILTLKYGLTLFMIYAATFILNVFTAFYGIVIEAATPNLVTDKKLISINSISRIISSSSSILGPMLGGIVFAFLDIKIFIIVNSISFIVSALFQVFINFKFNCKKKAEETERSSIFGSITEGLHYIKNRKDLISIFSIFIALNFFIGFSINVPLPYIVNNVLKLSPNSYGIINAAFPAGMILGALLVSRTLKKYSYEKIMKYASLALSACMLFIGLSVILHFKIDSEIVYLLYFIVIMSAAGTVISFLDLPISYIIQSTVPEEFRGRVLSLALSLAKVVLPAALIIAGALINHIPEFILPIAGGVLLCAFSIFSK